MAVQHMRRIQDVISNLDSNVLNDILKGTQNNKHIPIPIPIDTRDHPYLISNSRELPECPHVSNIPRIPARPSAVPAKIVFRRTVLACISAYGSREEEGIPLDGSSAGSRLLEGQKKIIDKNAPNVIATFIKPAV
jgi:hypothetical protein